MSAPGHRRPAGHARIEAAKAARERAARRRQQRPYVLGGIGVVVVALLGVFLLTQGNDSTTTATTGTTVAANPPFAYGTGACAPSSPPTPGRHRLPRHQRLPTVHQPGQPLHRHVRHLGGHRGGEPRLDQHAGHGQQLRAARRLRLLRRQQVVPHRHLDRHHPGWGAAHQQRRRPGPGLHHPRRGRSLHLQARPAGHGPHRHNPTAPAPSSSSPSTTRPRRSMPRAPTSCSAR